MLEHSSSLRFYWSLSAHSLRRLGRYTERLFIGFLLSLFLWQVVSGKRTSLCVRHGWRRLVLTYITMAEIRSHSSDRTDWRAENGSDVSER